jgi:hypothetical protein
MGNLDAFRKLFGQWEKVNAGPSMFCNQCEQLQEVLAAPQ